MSSAMDFPSKDAAAEIAFHHDSDDDADLALHLQLEEIDDVEAAQKGKQKEGQLSDFEVSLDAMRRDLLDTRAASQDHRMAVSMNAAIITDQDAIFEIFEAEQRDAIDHAIASTLSKDEETAMCPNTDRPVDTNTSEISNLEADYITTVLVSLQREFEAQRDRAIRTQAGPSSSFQLQDESAQCVSCLDNVDEREGFRSACGHRYCRECLRRLFLGATKDENLFPPRCCGAAISPAVALRILDHRELSQFGAKGVEFDTRDRIYCADHSCSTFVPPWFIQNDDAQCPTCQKTTHVPCRTLSHPNAQCPPDESQERVLALAEAEGWRRCFNCGSLVELDQGCNHITCRCGREFCYVCGREWKGCECPVWDEQRLFRMADLAIEEVQPEADEDEREAALARAVAELLDHEENGCRHHVRTQWRIRRIAGQQCEVCSIALPYYIFECKSCHMRACNRCIRNRLR